MSGVLLIAQERKRRKRVEGWTAEHDAHHRCAELARAAVCYTRQAIDPCRVTNRPPGWPASWDGFWKPSDDPVRNLVKAGALIASEIDRIQRSRRITHAPTGARP
jgi:hypothetical protein